MKKYFFVWIIIFQSLASFAQKFEWVSSAYSPNSTGSVNTNSQVITDCSGNSYWFGFFGNKIILGNDTLIAYTGNYDLFLTKVDALGNFIWSKKLGGNSIDIPTGISLNNQGHLFLSAEIQNNNFYSTDTSFNIAGTATYIISFDTSGNFRWLTQAYSGTGNVDQIKGSKLDSDFYYIASNSIVKMSDAGTQVWIRTATDPDIEFTALSVNDHGRIAVACINGTPSTYNLDTVTVTHHANYGASYGVFTMNSFGSALWGRIIADSTQLPKLIQGIGISNQDNAVYAGIRGNEIFQFANDSVVNTYYSLDKYGAVLKFDSTGNPKWAKSFFAENFTINDLIVNSSDEIVFCGRYDHTLYCQIGNYSLSPAINGLNMYVSKIDNSGNVIWIKSDPRDGGYAGGWDCDAYHLCEQSNGTYAVGGYNSVPVYFGCYYKPMISIGLELFFMEISENQEPISAFSKTNTGLTYQFTDMSVGAYSWDWDFGDGNFSTQQNPSHSYSSSGFFVVKLYINDSTCTNGYAFSADTIFISSTVELNFNEYFLHINPNPASQITVVSCLIPANISKSHFNIYSIEGRFLKRIPLSNRGIINFNLSTEEMNNGLYLLELICDETVVSFSKLSIVK